jgi:hypothetical protein
MNHINPVNDEHRRANQKAIRARAGWRERYMVLGNCIRWAKTRLQDAHRSNSFDRAAEIELLALRTMANSMMIDRAWIAEDLRSTSYAYVDVSELEKAA